MIPPKQVQAKIFVSLSFLCTSKILVALPAAISGFARSRLIKEIKFSSVIRFSGQSFNTQVNEWFNYDVTRILVSERVR